MGDGCDDCVGWLYWASSISSSWFSSLLINLLLADTCDCRLLSFVVCLRAILSYFIFCLHRFSAGCCCGGGGGGGGGWWFWRLLFDLAGRRGIGGWCLFCYVIFQIILIGYCVIPSYKLFPWPWLILLQITHLCCVPGHHSCFIPGLVSLWFAVFVCDSVVCLL